MYMKDILEAFRAKLPPEKQKNYSIAKILTENGLHTPTQTVDGWENTEKSKHINVPATVLIKRIGKFSWPEIGRLLESMAEKSLKK